MKQHTGNTQPAISQEEHDATIDPPTKRVTMYGYDGTEKNILYIDDNGTMRSIVTIASAINTSFAGNVTLNPSSAHIGSVSVFGSLSASLGGNVTLNPSENWIGLATTTIGSSPTLYAVVNTTASSGLATVTLVSTPTLFAVVNTAAAGQSSVVLDTGSNFIGLVTVANTIPVTGTFWQATQPVSGTFWQTTQPVSLVGQATLNASPNWIGIVSTASINGKVEVSALPAIPTGTNWIGLVSTATINGRVGIVDPTGADLDLFKQDDNFAVGGDHGLMILTVDDGTPKKYQPLRSHATIADNSSNDLARLTVVSSNKIFNGTGWDRLRTATAGNATTGPGILGAGIMGFDGTNYRRIITGTDGRIQGNVTINNSLTFGSNVSLNASSAWIGLVSTASIQGKVDIVSAPAIATGTNWIGLVSIPSVIGKVDIGTLPAVTATNLDIRDLTSASDSVAAAQSGTWNIGTVTAVTAISNALPAGDNNIGNVDIVTAPAIATGANWIGLVSTASIQGKVDVLTLPATPTGTNFIGLATVVPAVPTSIVHGIVSSASGGVIQFGANVIRWIQIKAMANNPTTVYLGSSSATVTTGYAMEPGEGVGFDISNSNLLYFSNGYGTASVRFIAGN